MILKGKSAASGYAVGKIFIHNNHYKIPVECFVSDNEVQFQISRYFSVKKEALKELEKIKSSVKKYDPIKAEIFQAHQEIIEDIIINEEIPSKISKEHWSGDWAIYQVYETVLVVLRQTPDPVISERAADFEDIRSLLLRLWYGNKKDELAEITDPVILTANELHPSDTARIDKNKVLAILTGKGGISSHSAIIAKSFGIPAVLGIIGLLDFVKHGQLAAVNAYEGEIILDPDKNLADEYSEKSILFRQNNILLQKFLKRESCTKDGEKIDIGLNIEDVSDEELSASEYTDSVAVFRTEFIYLKEDTLPSEDEQYSVYRKVIEHFGNRPVILRTLDIGGDKQLSCMKIPSEDNPFLGNRALRFCFSNPDIFKTQLKAALRASVYGNLWLMFPMVASLEDIRMAKEHIVLAKDALKKEKIAFNEIKTGIMIEIPSIAFMASEAAKEVDFASIGSNDLCQYLCAADRMNVEVEKYYQSYHPAMFRIIKEIVTSFTKAGKSISICGELGSDSLAVPLLIGLGLRKFGMGAASVAAVKKSISSITLKKCEEVAQQVLKLSTASEIKNYLADVEAAL
jgi:phosphotransferase system enzyme I (PtsI)